MNHKYPKIHISKSDKVSSKVRLSKTVNLQIPRTGISSHIRDTALILTVKYLPKHFVELRLKKPLNILTQIDFIFFSPIY